MRPQHLHPNEQAAAHYFIQASKHAYTYSALLSMQRRTHYSVARCTLFTRLLQAAA
jgi:hypothetical protein